MTPPPGFGAPYAGAPGAAGPAGAPPALFDDASLPEWLRAATVDQPPVAAPAPYPPAGGPGGPGFFVAGGGAPMRPVPPAPYSMPGPSQPSARPYAGAAPAGNMPANALLDSSALPTWLGGSGATQEPAAPANPLGGDGLTAGSLVDERSLPLWLRQQPAPVASNAPPAGSVSEWLASPVTDEPLPSWLNQVYSSAQVPRLASEAPAPSPFGAPSRPSGVPSGAPWGGGAGPGTTSAAGGTPVGNLVDDAALPDWLRAQAGPNGGPEAPGGVFNGGAGSGFSGGGTGWSAAGTPVPTGGWGNSPSAGAPAGSWASSPENGTSGAFAASDLIDPQALPGWVQREQVQPEFSSVTGWTSKQAAPSGQASSGAGGGPWQWSAGGAEQNLSAPAGSAYQPESVWSPAGFAPSTASVDEANLPPWLRAPGAAADFSGPSGPAGANGRHAARAPEGSIPESELPPWLRSGAGAEPAPDMQGAPYMPSPQGAPGDYGRAPAMAPASSRAAPGQASGKRRAAGQPPVHYADRFGEERPGGRFGYAYDFGEGDGTDDLDGWDYPPEEALAPSPPANKRRGLFGRK